MLFNESYTPGRNVAVSHKRQASVPSPWCTPRVRPREKIRRPSDDVLSFYSGTSLGSSGSRERSLDSDSEPEEAGRGSQEGVARQESETSAEDEQLSPRGSEDGAPPALPDSEPPDTDDVEQDLASSLAQLNTNQSNNTAPAPLGLPLARLCGGKLAKGKDRNREPEFV